MCIRSYLIMAHFSVVHKYCVEIIKKRMGKCKKGQVNELLWSSENNFMARDFDKRFIY